MTVTLPPVSYVLRMHIRLQIISKFSPPHTHTVAFLRNHDIALVANETCSGLPLKFQVPEIMTAILSRDYFRAKWSTGGERRCRDAITRSTLVIILRSI